MKITRSNNKKRDFVLNFPRLILLAVIFEVIEIKIISKEEIIGIYQCCA
jgi:hypothetical protein